MMEHKVTALKVQKRNPNRVNVYLDGEYALGLARIVAAWLQVGQELTDAEIERLQTQDGNEKALQTALRMLSYRPRSEAEIKKKLSQKGFPNEVIEQIMDRLRQNGLLDDAQFAQAWVENQANFRPRGRRVLALELRMKGISPEVIEETLPEAGDEEALAYQAGNSQAKRWNRLEWKDFRLKMTQFLARRGFTYETIVPTVKRIWDEVDSGAAHGVPSTTNDIEEEEERWT
jgi:regulatory protein